MRKNGNVRLRLMRQCGDRDEGIRLRVERGIRAATQDGMLGEFRYSGYAVDRYLLDEADRLARRTVLASMLEKRTNFVSQARLRLAPAAAKDAFVRYKVLVRRYCTLRYRNKRRRDGS